MTATGRYMAYLAMDRSIWTTRWLTVRMMKPPLWLRCCERSLSVRKSREMLRTRWGSRGAGITLSPPGTATAGVRFQLCRFVDIWFVDDQTSQADPVLVVRRMSGTLLTLDPDSTLDRLGASRCSASAGDVPVRGGTCERRRGALAGSTSTSYGTGPPWFWLSRLHSDGMLLAE